MIKPSKRTVAVTTGAFLIAGSTAALAFWTQSGTGTGSASTGTTSALTFTQGTAPSNLVPDGAAQPIPFTITNPGDSPVKVTGVTISIPDTWHPRADTNKPACTSADFEIVQSSYANANLVGGASDTDATATIRLLNSAANQDNCKNVSVDLAFDTNS